MHRTLCTLLLMLVAGTPLAAAAPDPVPAGSAAPRGAARLEGRGLADDAGPYLGLGVTYMQALRRCKYDRARFESDLAFLAAQGFNTVRILTMVAWPGREIAPVAFRARDGRAVEAWPDYWDQFAAALDQIAAHGMRAQITVFADAGEVMPSREARLAHLERLLTALRGRESRVAFIEVANEAWQNGFAGAEGIAELRAAGQWLAERTPILIALSATPEPDDGPEGLDALYRGSAADLATYHFTRDLRSPLREWLPVRACWPYARRPGLPPVVSNEPIGPGASVAEERDPARLVAAAAVAWIAGLPHYTFHCEAGVYGATRFEDTPGARDFRAVRTFLPPDLPNWTRFDGLETTAPLTLRAPADCLAQLVGATRGRECVGLAFALDDLTRLTAREAIQLTFHNVLDGASLGTHSLAPGGSIEFPRGEAALLIKATLAAPRGESNSERSD